MGILIGLYFKFSIAFLYILIVIIYYALKTMRNKNKRSFKLFSIIRYARYLKLYISKISLFIFIISSIISNTITLYLNNKYETSFENEKTYELIGVVTSSEKKEKEYYDQYKIKLDNKELYIKLDKKEKELEYGDKVKIKGIYEKPSKAQNYGGFDYQNYLKSIGIIGVIDVEKIEVLEKNKGNFIVKNINDLSKKIKEKTELLFKDEEEQGLIQGLILGDKTNVSEEIQENFEITNLSHILAVSGMHITYLIIGMQIVFQKLAGKKITNIIMIVFLIIYMILAGSSPSVVRSVVMGILTIFSKLVYRKNDIINSISISLLILLIINPYVIGNIGLQLSYLGTLGIVLFQKTISSILEININKDKYKIKKESKLVSKIKEMLSVSISAQILIFPIMIFHFNLFSIYFLLTNLLASVIIGPIIIISFLVIILSFIFLPIAKLISYFLSFLIQVLLLITKMANLPFSKIYFPTPKLYKIIIYYILIFILNFLYKVYKTKNQTGTTKRVRNIVAVVKYKIRENRNKVNKVSIIVFLCILVINFIPKDLEIHFVDVGQGDCTFIETPRKKTILIDGGGAFGNYDVGKNTLLPYILDRGYTKIDYLFISHFDTDHVKSALTILEELNVKNVYISKQFEDSENYQEFLKIVKKKNVFVKVLEKGDIVKLEKNLEFEIIWPDNENIVDENILNNNAMVMKLKYKEFSMLFTGDIEEKAEIEILKNTSKEKLKCDILKIAHHGSKTSSTQEFLDIAKPQIALIGVGKNNLFGHPNENVLERLKEKKCKIYRTDLNGEISIKINCINLTKAVNTTKKE